MIKQINAPNLINRSIIYNDEDSDDKIISLERKIYLIQQNFIKLIIFDRSKILENRCLINYKSSKNLRLLMNIDGYYFMMNHLIVYKNSMLVNCVGRRIFSTELEHGSLQFMKAVHLLYQFMAYSIYG
jgi:hypothetical protein